VVSADSQIKLIVIDPLSDFCGSKKLLAEAIHRLNRLADEKQIAIVVTLRATARFNRQGELVVKSKHDTEAARCQWCCLADPEDPARRLFVPTLMNYARLPKGQAFQPGELAFDWLPGEVDLNDPLRNITPSGKWLKEILKGGPRPAEELKELGKKFGFSAGQLQRAVYEVGGTKDRDNYRKGSKSMWSLQQQLEAAVEAELRAMADAGPLAATAGTENPPLPLGEGRGEGKCPTDPRPENQIPAVQQPAERQRDDERESNDRPHPNPLPEGEGKRLVPSESSSDPSGSPPVAVVKEPAAPVEPKPSVAPVRPVRPLSEQVYIPWDDSPSSRLNPLNAMLDAPQNPNQLRRNVKSVKSNEEMRSRTDAPRESVEGGT
jgi:hypothetical protein